MRLFHGTDNAEIARPTVLTLGVFDGLHLGHQLIMKTVVERARAIDAVPTVITFEPHPHNRVIPRGGVYVTATLIEGQWRRSVTNIGTRPTFGDATESSVETFVMNWLGDLYGDVVRVRFLHRLRDEKKFNSIDELKSQIERDVAHAERFF